MQKRTKSKSKEIDWKGITVLRYNGWAFSTPLMLVAFLLFLSANTNIKVSLRMIITIILLDWLMISLGYLGEIGYMDRTVALITGFIPSF
jgi:bacteriorhodopsin